MVSQDYLCLLVSPILGGSDSSWVLASFIDPRGAVDFSVLLIKIQ